MTEEIQDENIEQIEEMPEPTAEDIASEQGWVPKKDWVARGGDPKEWVNAEVYVARGPIMEQVKQMKRELSAVVQHNQALTNRLTEAEKAGYEKAIQELKYYKRQAQEEGNFDAVERIDQDIQKNQEALKERANQVQPPPREVIEFVERNKDWWPDQELSQIAVRLEKSLEFEFPDDLLSERYEKLEKKMEPYLVKKGYRKEKPQRRPVDPRAVSNPARSTAQSKETYSINDLTDAARAIYKDIARKLKDAGRTDYSVDEYVKKSLANGYIRKEEIIRG